MKKLSLLILMCLLWHSGAKAQTGLQFSFLAPRGIDNYMLYPTLEVEFTESLLDADEHFNLYASIGITRFSSRRDTFYTLIPYPSYPTIKQGWEVIHSRWIEPISLSGEYKFLMDKKVTPFAGLDLTSNFMESFISRRSIMGTESGPEEDWILGGHLKAGLIYNYNEDWYLSFGFARNFSLIGTNYMVDYYKTYLRISKEF